MIPLPKELEGAIPIVRTEGYAITNDRNGHTLIFGLLGVDGRKHYFNIRLEHVARFGIDMHELARLAKHVALDPTTDRPPSHIPFALPTLGDGTLAPLIGPKLKIHRAIIHFEDLDDLITQYAQDVKIEAIEVARTGETATWEIQFSKPSPAIIPLFIGDTIHNLRSALDHIICDLARVNGKKAGRLKFPFAVNETELKRIMSIDKHLDILGQDVCDAILALRPYKENGSKLLRGLHDLDIADKHQLIVPSYFASWHKFELLDYVAEIATKDNPDAVIPKTILLSDGRLNHTYFKHGERMELPVGEDPLKHFRQLSDGVHVRFSDSAEIGGFSGEPVLETLAKFIELVQQIHVDFHANFLKP